MIRVLFVCMGNICRSPTAEGVFKRMIKEAGISRQILVDSAGTHDFHIGEPPDRRAQQAASRRGYDLSALRGRQVADRDFIEFDYILAMDRANLAILQQHCPSDHQHKVQLLLDFSTTYKGQEVPDPYFGGSQGFEKVLDMIEDASTGLIRDIQMSIATR